jgi:6-phosphofructokinase 1
MSIYIYYDKCYNDSNICVLGGFMFNIAVAQSGGPTCAINSSLAGVFVEARKQPLINTIYGSRNGIYGIINDNLIDLSTVLKNDEDVELLKCTPSTALGSCRYKLPDVEKDESVYETIIRQFEKYNIKAFFYIGGNDSMDTVAKLSKYIKLKGLDIKVIGIPKTIDNDVAMTDHTPGFGSAAKFIATTMQEIIRDSSVYRLDSVTIVEIMGRDAGWLTASSGILKVNGETAPHLIYLPEIPFSIEKFIEDIKAVQKKSKSVIVAVSEGLKLENGQYVASKYLSGCVDAFGHQYLAGLGKYLEGVVKEKINCKVRSIELNVLQRCSSHIASKTDIEEAMQVGREAVKAALNGETGVMLTFERTSNSPYQITFNTAIIDNIANKEKFFPLEWINEDKNGITDEAIEYILPLIQGEIAIPMKNGIPVHMVF